MTLQPFRAAFYRGTRPGTAGLYNRFVRWWDVGPYSHVELVFPEGDSASASFEDGGVRFKDIRYSSDTWDFLELPAHLAPAARRYFEAHDQEGYDLLGNVHFMFGPVEHGRDQKFCSEAVAEGLGLTNAWRFTPNSLYAVLLRLVLEDSIQLSQVAA